MFISQALHRLINLSLVLSIIDRNPCKYKVNLSQSLWLRVPRPRRVPTAVILPKDMVFSCFLNTDLSTHRLMQPSILIREVALYSGARVLKVSAVAEM